MARQNLAKSSFGDRGIARRPLHESLIRPKFAFQSLKITGELGFLHRTDSSHRRILFGIRDSRPAPRSTGSGEGDGPGIVSEKTI